MKNDIDKEFYLTRGQYAQKINKSKGAVIQAMRRGGLKDEYIVKDGKYPEIRLIDQRKTLSK